ncbi:MAG: hypothetical protein HY761_08500 [Candidatus Omnitrophica bacterium]|nr:hypothetical protein [Candidatus Omnitrophota bacterium]
MKLLKAVTKSFLNSLRPLVEQAARFYGIEVRRSFVVYGQNNLVFEEEQSCLERFVPKSTYFNVRSGNIHVGKNTMFGENVMVITGKHMDVAESGEKGLPLYSVPTEGRDISIGESCFIGSGAIILGKVNIGDFSVIGAGAVVTKDVPERVFVAGTPAKIIKKL